MITAELLKPSCHMRSLSDLHSHQHIDLHLSSTPSRSSPLNNVSSTPSSIRFNKNVYRLKPIEATSKHDVDLETFIETPIGMYSLDYIIFLFRTLTRE